MTNNLVTVNASMLDAAGNSAQGHWLFAATGTLMTSSYVAIVAPVVDGDIDATGQMNWINEAGNTVEGAQLLASDNFETGALYWNFFGDFQGMARIHVTGIPVNFALGATQNLFTILAANGWVPQSL
jgi:hypothetical protein